MSGASAPDVSVRLRPYVPRLVVDWLRATPDETFRQVEGSLAFVDISGFTQLTERLARRGKVGAEEMSDTLNATFSALLSEAYEEGAGLVKWGGDAVLLLFDGPDHATRACRAAHQMRARMREVGRVTTPAGRVTLRMSVGIHSGTFHFFLVGDPAQHRELIVSGPAASRTAEMEALAAAGQIAVSADTAELLGPSVLGARVGDAYLLRSLPDLPVVGVVPPKDVRHVDLTSVVPPAIREQVLAQSGDAEHRTIAVAFVQFSGTDDLLVRAGPAALAAALDQVVRNVQDATAQHGVTFFETDINRDGGKIMLTAGAPRSLGHEEERMLRAARLIVDRIGELPLRIGVNRGPVFSGDFGPPFRRTYSVKGDAINLAARVMGKAAPGQLLATREVIDRSSTVFETEPLEPFMVKGKSRPVHASSVGLLAGARDAERGLAPLVGRDTELAVLDDALDDARRGRGRLVDLVGEPGIGKSRLVEELLSHAEGAVVLVAGCEEYESSTPYHPIRHLLRDVLGIPAAAGVQDVVDRLRHRVEANAPELVPWLPLVGVPLDLPIPDTAETARLDPQFRKARTEEVIGQLLALTLPTLTVLVLDDVHLMDDASADLVTFLVGSVATRPWLVLATRREEVGGWHAEPGAATEVRLGPLDAAAALSMVGSGTAESPLPPHEMEQLAKRAGGNPLFLRALVETATDRGSVEGLPDSLEDLITSQIDRLPPEERTVLRYASVLGVAFTEGQLRSMLEGEPVPTGRATMRRLAYFLEPEGHGRYRFQHELIRDAAYEGLPFRRRRALHARVGTTVEASVPDPDEQSALLSLHFYEAGSLDKAWHYSRVAGDRAAAKYAYVEASEFFRRAVSAARGLADLGSSDLGDVHEALGDAQRRIGALPAAKDAYRSARRTVTSDPRRTSELLRKEALVDHDLDRVPQALRTLTRAMHLVHASDGTWVEGQLGELESDYAGCRHEQGRYREAIRWARLAEAHAQAAGELRALAQAYEVLQMAHVLSGRPQDRAYGQLALEIFQRLADQSSQAKALNNLAVLAWMEGRGREALAMFERASAAFSAAGDTLHAAMADYNRGDVLLRQNRIPEARAILERLLPVMRALDSDNYWAPTLRGLGLADLREGRVQDGLDKLDRARQTVERLGFAAEVVETDLAIVEGLLAAGTDEGLRRADELAATATARARAMEAGYLLPSLLRLRALARERDGDLEGARALLEEARQLCAEEAQCDLGFVLADLARVTSELGDPMTGAGLARQSRDALDLLGYQP